MTSNANAPRSALGAFSYYYGQLLDILLALSVLILVFPVSLQIFSRFTSLIPHYIWTEEMARFLFIWTIMIGSMVGVRDNVHFDVDLWPDMGRRGNALLNLSGRIGVLVLAYIFVYAGIEFTRFAWHRTSELAELPLWLIHIAWPLTGLTWFLYAGQQAYADLRIIFGAK
ncbi:TRAP transporter small permease subunit [Rhizobiales bacterium TNE-4]|nr:TRAP transporter small permease subunit [Rhizobiales bacterium TNE-4]MBV1828011.1 TRAP transporter small permease subunit [Rhizobiales bacterium TNE-4]